jgi:REP element-mobilizing transposase RayT
MGRRERPKFAGAIYHVATRGNMRQLIYLDAVDRWRWLDTAEEVVAEHDLVCHAYCLMGNHYHALFETPEGNIDSAMRQLNGVYAKRFNRRHSRTDHVFGKRYWCEVVDRDSYLLALCRYIVRNPVRAGLCTHPGEWPWSSYAATVGRDEPVPFLTTSWVLGQFNRITRRAQEQYAAFVADGDADDRFRELERRRRRARLESLVAVGNFLDAREEGFTLREIAAAARVDASTVLRRVRAADAQLRRRAA